MFMAVLLTIATNRETTCVSYCRLSKLGESKIMRDNIVIKRMIVKLNRNTRIAHSYLVE